jgi:hypothetical protein
MGKPAPIIRCPWPMVSITRTKEALNAAFVIAYSTDCFSADSQSQFLASTSMLRRLQTGRLNPQAGDVVPAAENHPQSASDAQAAGLSALLPAAPSQHKSPQKRDPEALSKLVLGRPPNNLRDRAAAMFVRWRPAQWDIARMLADAETAGVMTSGVLSRSLLEWVREKPSGPVGELLTSAAYPLGSMVLIEEALVTAAKVATKAMQVDASLSALREAGSQCDGVESLLTLVKNIKAKIIEHGGDDPLPKEFHAFYSDLATMANAQSFAEMFASTKTLASNQSLNKAMGLSPTIDRFQPIRLTLDIGRAKGYATYWLHNIFPENREPDLTKRAERFVQRSFATQDPFLTVADSSAGVFWFKKLEILHGISSEHALAWVALTRTISRVSARPDIHLPLLELELRALLNNPQKAGGVDAEVMKQAPVSSLLLGTDGRYTDRWAELITLDNHPRAQVLANLLQWMIEQRPTEQQERWRGALRRAAETRHQLFLDLVSINPATACIAIRELIRNFPEEQSKENADQPMPTANPSAVYSPHEEWQQVKAGALGVLKSLLAIDLPEEWKEWNYLKKFLDKSDVALTALVDHPDGKSDKLAAFGKALDPANTLTPEEMRCRETVEAKCTSYSHPFGRAMYQQLRKLHAGAMPDERELELAKLCLYNF